MQLETDRLTIRSFRENDAYDAWQNSSKPNVAHFMSDMVMHSEEEALGWIRWINSQCDTEKSFQVLAIELRKEKKCIGLIGVAPKRELDGEVEILFEIADEYTRKGYATEAGNAMIDWYFSHTTYDHLAAIVKPNNISSNQVIKKLGFIFIDQRQSYYDGQEVLFNYYRKDKPPFSPLEPMADFFDKRADGYDDHMMNDLDLSEFYKSIDKCFSAEPGAIICLTLAAAMVSSCQS
jgi:ribosomal-protein-alanine N-acetyltransferase